MNDSHLMEQIEFIRAKLKQLETTNQIYINDYALGVDPAFGGSSETGIILGGRTRDRQIIILGDLSGHYKPETWIYYVQKLAMEFQSTIAIEINHGGELLSNIFANFSVAPQRAFKSKYERAIACYILYKKGLVTHLHPFIKLEEQMLYFEKTKKDRVDALVWLVTYLNQLNNNLLHCDALHFY